MIPSVFTSEQELLKAIIGLHCPNGIQLDPMYFKGNFYKDISKPTLKFDLNPQVIDCITADAASLPISSNSINSMILDPPFMFGIHGKTEKYYSSRTHGIFANFVELEALYKGILLESNRILVSKGVLIFKCQDFTDSKTILTHCYVWKWAEELGFYSKDLAILYLLKNKIYNSNLTQRHTRKVHSYFYVFIKKSRK